MSTVGLIGAGNMGGAILRGILSAGYVKASQVVICDTNQKRMEELADEIPEASFCDSACDLVEQSDYVILAVKPFYLADVIKSVVPYADGKNFVSIAAGWTMSMLKEAFAGTDARFMRVMPNTPALVGEGMTAICEESTMDHAAFEFAKGIFDAVGKTAVLAEHLFDGVIAISGSSPAYAYMMIEAMGDAGVKEGLPRSIAYEMAAQALLGSALMVLQSGMHPGALKDAVCSPSGTTIEAVEELERKGFRAAIMDAMSVCAEKSRKMSR